MELIGLSSSNTQLAGSWNSEYRRYLGRVIRFWVPTSSPYAKPSTFRTSKPGSNTTRSKSFRSTCTHPSSTSIAPTRTWWRSWIGPKWPLSTRRISVIAADINFCLLFYGPSNKAGLSHTCAFFACFNSLSISPPILGLFKQQEFMKTTSASSFEMYIRQASPTTYRQVLREIRQKEIFKIIVDTNPANIYFFFRAVSLKLSLFRHSSSWLAISYNNWPATKLGGGLLTNIIEMAISISINQHDIFR